MEEVPWGGGSLGQGSMVGRFLGEEVPWGEVPWEGGFMGETPPGQTWGLEFRSLSSIDIFVSWGT